MQTGNNSKIFLKRSDKPSSFMVDLVSLAKEKEELLLEKEKNLSLLSKSKDKMKIFLQKDESLKNNNSNFYNDSPYEDNANFFDDNEAAHKKSSINPAISGLAFIQFFIAFFNAVKNFFKLIEKVCYRTGWLILFIVRFFYYFVFAILKGVLGIFRPLKTLFSAKSDVPTKIWQEEYQKDTTPVFHNLLDPESVADTLRQESIDEIVKDSRVEIDDNIYDNSNRIYLNTIKPVQKIYTANRPSSDLQQCDFRENSHSISQGLYKNVINQNSVAKSSIFQKFRFSYFKTTMFFAGFLLILVLPFKVLTYYGVLQDLGGRVLGASEEAIGDLKNAGTAANELDFFKAGEEFAEASDSFLRAQEQIESISGELKVISSIIPSNKLRLAADAEYILEAGAISSQIGKQLSFIFDTFSVPGDKSIKTVFNTFFNNIGPLNENISNLNQVLLKIDYQNLPEEYQGSFKLLQEKSGQINNSFKELSDLLDKLRIMLGFEGDKRYLLMYQNNSEMRASGGFMGSFSIIDFRDGEIIKIDTPKGGTYDTEAGYLDRIIAPEPLHIVNPLWHFWDANWWPDWKKTAKKLAWFYENSGGSSVDGVIGLTPVVVERLLELIGPLDMQDTHGVTITAENFWDITQTFAEIKPVGHPDYYTIPYEPQASSSEQISTTTSPKDPGTEPKKIIGDLVEEIKTELPKRLTKEIFLGLIAGLEQSLSEKHVLFYFNDWTLQNKFEELGWAGRVKKTAWDYLMVVNSNISGAKSDRKIEQTIEHLAEVQDDGSIVDTLVIRRTHTGAKGEKFSGVKNLNWMRVYLPLGSQFVEASGFWPPDESLFEKPDPSWRHDPDLANSEENFVRDSKSWTKIYNEDDKTVFANWVQVDPGETVEIRLKYILPFKLRLDREIEQPYALLVEKQPGAMPSVLKSRFIFDNKFDSIWKYPDDLTVATDGWYIEDVLSEDSFFATILK